MIRWEYRGYLFEPGDKIVEILNKMGAEGWEAFTTLFDGKGVITQLFLKRQKT